ncbi:hypothetical protein sos41_02990 [Alphaproteobacteria bacterium SO-S41]|nr:hypothetical protein sos41_02990 [Alphaproteobacteria bacterium SO-S41]
MKLLHGFLAVAIAALAGACASVPPPPPPVVDSMARTVDGVRLDPQAKIDPALLSEALASYARHYGTVKEKTVYFDFPDRRVESQMSPIGRDVIGVIDFRIPATRPRFFIVDLHSGAVAAFRVAHGRNSDAGGDINTTGPVMTTGGAVRASNLLDTNESSVGAYVAANVYEGRFDLGAVRLHGLDDTNSCVFWRAIVMHQARYMTPDPATGVVGTSDGCLAVEVEQRPIVSGYIANGGFVYAGPVSLHVPSAADGARSQSACEAVRLKPENGPQPPLPGS